MGDFHELRVRSNEFVSNLQVYIEEVIDDNPQLLDLNRKQLKDEHKTSKDVAISPPYSPFTAQRKGFKTPDLYDTGETQKTLTIEAKGNQYEIKGHTEWTQSLISRYGADIFGIATSRLAEARQITTKKLSEIYRKVVFK